MEYIKLIAFIILSVILFFGVERLLYRVSDGDNTTLVRWSIKCSTFFLLLSFIATMYDEYQKNKSLDILIGLVSGNAIEFFRGYLLVAINLFYITMVIITNWIRMRWRGTYNLTLEINDKRMMAYTIVLVFNPILNLFYIGLVILKLWNSP